mgnify:CR=1
MIRNINYKGRVGPNIIRDMRFSSWKPRQYIDRSSPYTIILFKSGRCRIMGCKDPLDPSLLPYPITDITIQSVTVTADLGTSVNLCKISSMFTVKIHYVNFI